ncbi:hypothetical protein J3A64_002195 [Pseudarthrobacter sp. PvP004]|nr:hypothetical protein [Pseudarthrobacter sp. PvP004]
MQARSANAVTGLNGANDLTPADSVAGLEFTGDGFKAALEAIALIDGQHRAINYDAGKGHHAIRRRGDRAAVGRWSQVHPSMPAEPRFVRRVKCSQDGRLGGERPAPPGLWRGRSAARPSCDNEGKNCGHDELQTGHEPSLP